MVCRNECRNGRKKGQNYLLLYQNSTNLTQKGIVKCSEKIIGSFAEIPCRNQGTEKSADAEISAESRAGVCADSRAESCAVVDTEMDRRAEPCADVRAVFCVIVRAEKIAPMQKHLQIQSG